MLLVQRLCSFQGTVYVPAWSLNYQLRRLIFHNEQRATSDENRVSFPCGYGEGEPPVPIPNTAVKPLSADGTGRVTGWESRSLQGNYLLKSPLPKKRTFPLYEVLRHEYKYYQARQ